MNLFYHNNCLEVGCDEAGRGCLAGPVVAAAVLFPPVFFIEKWEKGKQKKFYDFISQLNDSKKLSEKKREFLREHILENCLAFGIASCSPEEIDNINILNASILAMHRAISKLLKKYNKIDSIIVDGNRFKPYIFDNKAIPHDCIIKGDAKFASIAAASILAKTERDSYMANLSKEFPQFNWGKNKGYPTKDHREAIAKFGPTMHHRKSFALLPELSLF